MRSQILPPEQIFTQNIQDFKNLLDNPTVKLENIITLPSFGSLWTLCDERLYEFIIQHYDELIEIGFQLKEKSRSSLRCMQIMIASNKVFKHMLYTQTDFIDFMYNYVFNINKYPSYSHKNYFTVLPNIMFDDNGKLVSKFDGKFFVALFENIQNEIVYNYVLNLVSVENVQSSTVQIIKQNDIMKIIVNHFTKDGPYSIKRYHRLFMGMVGGRYDSQAIDALLEEIDGIIKFAIEKKDTDSFLFIRDVNRYASRRFWFSKWKKIHSHVIPHIAIFCRIGIENKAFTPISEACIKLSISITETTGEVRPEFMNLFANLSKQFFEYKRNDFLHICFLNCLNLLLSYKKYQQELLTIFNETDFFNRIIMCYEERESDFVSSYWGHLRVISEKIDYLAKRGKNIDLAKWNSIVIEKNKLNESIIKRRYGGPLPFNPNERDPFMLYFYCFIFILFSIIVLIFSLYKS